MPHQNNGILIIIIGVATVGIGLLVWSGALSWFGRLPGDIRIDRGSFHFYFPLMSMIVVSVVLSVLVRLFGRMR